MNFKNLIGNVMLSLKKASPEIGIVAGVLLMGGAVVTAAIATPKAIKANEERKEHLRTIDIYNEKHEDETYTEKVYKSDIRKEYVACGVTFVKLYAPAVLLFAGGAASVFCGAGILKQRNVALSAALASATASFDEYRRRVKNAVGEEVEQKIRNGIVSKEFKTVETDKKGKEIEKTETVDISEGDPAGLYTMLFDREHFDAYQAEGYDYNMSMLKGAQSDWNTRLQLNGFVFLNDIYEYLGHEKTLEGQVVGWTYNKGNPQGDNYIDFGLETVNRDRGGWYSKDIILNFNVQGNIINSLPKTDPKALKV